MHRDLMNLGYLTGTERGQNSKQFVAELHDWRLSPDDAADVVCQVYGVSRGAARLYVYSHPAWASEAPTGGCLGTRGSAGDEEANRPTNHDTERSGDHPR
jgi:hypothetical protein